MPNAISALGEFTLWTVAAISITGLFFHIRWSRKYVAVGPTFLTTSGIFFCFFGIALALLDFDAEDVRGSVPALLNGIRTSFWASVAGIFWALTIKARSIVLGDPELNPDSQQ